MSDQGDDPQDDAVRKDAAVVDDYVRVVFDVEPAEDRLGLFCGPPRATVGKPDADAGFEAYMRSHFPYAAD